MTTPAPSLTPVTDAVRRGDWAFVNKQLGPVTPDEIADLNAYGAEIRAMTNTDFANLGYRSPNDWAILRNTFARPFGGAL